MDNTNSAEKNLRLAFYAPLHNKYAAHDCISALLSVIQTMDHSHMFSNEILNTIGVILRHQVFKEMWRTSSYGLLQQLKPYGKILFWVHGITRLKYAIAYHSSDVHLDVNKDSEGKQMFNNDNPHVLLISPLKQIYRQKIQQIIEKYAKNVIVFLSIYFLLFCISVFFINGIICESIAYLQRAGI